MLIYLNGVPTVKYIDSPNITSQKEDVAELMRNNVLRLQCFIEGMAKMAINKFIPPQPILASSLSC